MNRTLTRTAPPILAVATALALAACSSTTSASGHDGMPGMSSTPSAAPLQGPAASGPHNQADVAFATGMIPHHAQAVTMADMASTRATNAKVRDLAAAIKAAQDPEIKTMSGWLIGWGQPVPATDGHDMSQMGASGSATTSGSDPGAGDGMMSDQEMRQLSNTTGPSFDRMWLQLMIRHHQGAVATAKTELAAGTNPDAKKLAQTIIDGQTAEIRTMTGLLPTITG